MPRRRSDDVEPKRVPGWVLGLRENVDPELMQAGSIEFAENMVPKPGGKFATRGGRRTMMAFTDGTNALSSMLFVTPFTPTGCLVIGYRSASSKHYAFLCDSEISDQGTRVDMNISSSWGSPQADPMAVELFENAYICDAEPIFANREPLMKITAGGTPSIISQDLGGGSATLRPYCIETYGGVLFMAGYDDNSEEKAMLRHSWLLRDPAATGGSPGWSQDAWAIIGEAGKPITAMKRGRGVMLVAKQDGLWRVYGTPLAIDGFQFAQEPLDFGVGYGVENPLGLDYANGWWYGIGQSGPWRTNGELIDNLADRRRDSWDQLTGDVKYSWVSVHAERKAVMFGIPSATGYPKTVWVWDVIREEWAGEWTFSVPIKYGTSVSSVESVGPGGDPSGLNITGVTETSWTANWTNGDATAYTEVWWRTRDDVGNGTASNWALYDTVAPGVVLKNFTGHNGYTHYEVKVRHIKDGVPGDFTAAVGVWTDILEPEWVGAGGIPDTEDKVVLHTINTNKLGDFQYQRRSTESDCSNPGSWGSFTPWGQTVTNLPLGNHVFYDPQVTCDLYYQYQVRANDPDWPGVKTSAYVQAGIDDMGPECAWACHDDKVPY